MHINARGRVGTSYGTRQMNCHVGHDVARGGAGNTHHGGGCVELSMFFERLFAF